MTVKYTNGQWKADATQIESILSLWIFHVRQAEEDRKDRRTPKDSPRDRERAGTKRLDWLREGDAALRLPTMRILCRNSEPARQYLNWWGDISSAKVRAVQFISHNDSSSKEKTTRNFDRHRVVGCITSKPSDWSSIAPPCCNDDNLIFKLDADVSLDHSFDDSSNDSPAVSDLAVISDIPLPLLFAQHVFSAFMWSIAEVTEPIVGNTTLHQQDPEDWKKFRLENSTLRKIAAGIQQAGLGSIEEVYTYIIPPLGDRGKLPSAMAVLERARKQASHHQSLQQWKEAASVYLWLFPKCKAFDSKSPFAVKATALLMENLGFVTSTLELWKKQLHGTENLHGLRSALLKELETADPDVRSAIESVYRAEQLDGWNDSPSEIEQTMSSSAKNANDNETNNDETNNGETNNDETNNDEIDIPYTKFTEYTFFARQSAHSKVFSHRFYNLNTADNVNSADLLERTALHYAIASRDRYAVQQLLQLGADSKVGNLINWTPLHYASWFGLDEIGWLLLQHGADIDARGSDGRTPLHCASQRGHNRMVGMLLEGGANVNTPDGSRRTALHWAGYCGFKDIVGLLINANAVVHAREDQRRTALHLSAAAGRAECVDALLNANVDINTKDIFGDSAQMMAATFGHENVMRALWGQHNFDINSKGNNDQSALSRAAKNGHVNMVQALLEQPNVDISSQSTNGQSPLSWAANGGHLDVVRALLERPDVDINSQSTNGQSPLSWAANGGHLDVVRALLERPDVDINSQSTNCQSPLSWAAKGGHQDVVRAFLERPDVDINSKDSTYGLSPLSWAAHGGHLDVVRALLERPDVDVNSQRKNGPSPLSRAAKGGHRNVVRALLERPDVDINSQSTKGQSPLSQAAKRGHLDVVRALLERPDVDINSTDNDSHTALWWATEHDHTQVVELLQQRGARLG